MTLSANREGRQSERSASEQGLARLTGSGMRSPPHVAGERSWCRVAEGSLKSPRWAGLTPMIAAAARIAVARSRGATERESEKVKMRR